MSSMAKIFVVVNLVFAVCTFGAAATLLGAQDDYKNANVEMSAKFDAFQDAKAKEIETLNNQVAQQNLKAGQAVTEKNNAAQEAESYKTQLAQARTAAEKLQSSVEVYSESIAALQKQMADNVQKIKDMADTSRKMTTERLNATKALEDEVANRARLEVEVSKLSETIQQLSAEKGDLERKIRQAKFEIGEYAKKHGPLISGNRGSPGRVLAVKALGQGVLVSISVGTEDGVRTGDRYAIRRGSNFIGHIRIDRVMRGQAVGLFDTEFNGGNGNPDVGDVAAPSR